MNKAAPVQPEFTQNLDARNRNGTIWHLIFQASTIFGIIALIAMLLNIINGAMGYVAYEGRIDPATLTVDGITIEKQSREQLVSLLQTKLSKGAYNKLDNEKPFAERSRSEIYQLVLERVVRIEVKDNWNLWESLTQALGDLEAPKSIRDARAAFDETFSRVCREQAEELAPAVLELRQHRIREDV